MTPSLSDILQWQDDDATTALPSTGQAIGEPLATLGTGALSAGVGGVGGLLAAGMGMDPVAASKAADRFTVAHTYTPRTKAGAAALRGLLDTSKHFGQALTNDPEFGAPISMASDALDSAADAYPKTAAVAKMGTNAAGLLAPAASVASRGLGLLGDLADARSASPNISMLTAAKGVDPALDAANNKQLALDLDHAGIEYQPSKGVYQGQAPEEGFTAKPKNDAEVQKLNELGRKYNQDSVMHVNGNGEAGFFFGDGRDPMSIGRLSKVSRAEALAADGYTELADGTHYVTKPDAAPLGETLGGGDQLGRIGGRWNAGGKQTVKDPQRNAFPGIYSDPRLLVASADVAPEDPMLSRLFGVTRQDMYDATMDRKGNEAGVIPGAAKKPKGADSARQVMTPENTQRVSDVLGEAMNRKDLAQGMVPWYYMDPAFKRMETLMGHDEAVRQYKQFNTLTGMSSPGSDVHTELNRGTAAHMLAEQGRFPDFLKFAGMDAEDRTAAGAPADLMDILAHPYHKTAHTTPMAAYLDTGTSQMKSPKVPAYIQASGVPETGFQTDLPVADAHYSRGLGLADTRDWKSKINKKTGQREQVVPGASISKTELQTLQPWWQQLAAQHGLQSVPAQALQWGGMSTATGVKTAVGAPKLEILAGAMSRLAKKMGITPEAARDLVLQGKAYVPGTHTQAQIRAMLEDEE